MDIGFFENAPQWVKNVGAEYKEPFEAFGWYRIYEGKTDSVLLRDRFTELVLAVKGIAESRHSIAMLTMTVGTGKELKVYGFEPVRAQFVQKYGIILC